VDVAIADDPDRIAAHVDADVDVDVDVVIVGAGPAGAAAATVLARAGRSALLADKASFPRDKCCGDGLTTLALRELEALGLRPESVPNWQQVTDVWLRSPSGREINLPLPTSGQFAATTPRRELDNALVDLAVSAGAQLQTGWTISKVRHGTDRVVVRFDTGEEDRADVTVRARYLVAADGMWSPTRKMLGLATPGYLGEWHAVRQYISNVTGPASRRLYVWFEPDLLPGYAWSFPLPGGRANVGFGVPRNSERHGKQLKAWWPALLERPHIAAALGPNATLEDRYTAWPIPAGIDRAVLAHERTLFVGDAAMATDVMTGEGIGQAVLTGRLAAEAILDGQALDATRTRQHYQRAVHHHLHADHRMSARLSGILASERGARGALKLVDSNDWTRRNFARWMFEDEPRAVLLTPSRWHRRFLRQPGTYR
jgi:menaquinone-9 beta-reductase